MPRENKFELVRLEAERCRRLIAAVIGEAASEHFDRLKKRVIAIAGSDDLCEQDQRDAEAIAERFMRSGVSSLIELRRSTAECMRSVEVLQAEQAAAARVVESARAQMEGYKDASLKKAKAFRKRLKEAESKLFRANVRVQKEGEELRRLGGLLKSHESGFGATEWLLSEEEGPFTFCWCAEVIGISPAKARASLFRLESFVLARNRMAAEQAEWAKRVATSELFSI